MPSLQAGIDARGARKGAAEFIDAANRMAKAADKLAVRSTKADKALDKTGKSASSFGKAMKTAVAGISAAVVFTAATREIIGFGETMAELQGVVSGNADQMAALEGVARTLGATTKFTAQEAAEGLVFLARAGFSVEAQIAALPATLNLAAAGHLALGEAADFASNIVSQFALGAANTERVVDALVNTSNNANTNVRQLAEAMKFVGPIAGALGVDIETTSAAIGVLGDRGIQASMAGTNLRTIMLKLTKPTNEATQALKALGISLDEVNPENKGLIEIMERFGQANLTAAKANEIFGLRNSAAALIMADSTERMRTLVKIQEEGSGKAQEMADIMANTLGGALKSLRSAIGELNLQTGDNGLAGSLRLIVDTATDTVRVLVGMEHMVKGNVIVANLFAAAIKSAAAFVAVLVSGKLIVFFVGVAKAIKAATLAMAGLNTAMKFSPVTAIAGGIAALVFALGMVPDAAAAAKMKVKELTEEVKSMNDAVASIKELDVKIKRAEEVGDLEEQLVGITGQLANLKKASELVRDSTAKDFSEMAEAVKKLLGEDLLLDRVFAVVGAGMRESGGEAFDHVKTLIGVIEHEIRKAEKKQLKIRLQLETDREAANKVRQQTQEVDNAAKSLERLQEELKFAASIAHLDSEQREIAIAGRKAEQLAIKGQKENVKELVAEIKRLVKASQDAEKAGKDQRDQTKKDQEAVENVKKFIASLEAENEALKKSAEERQALQVVAQAEALLTDTNIKLSEEEKKKIKALIVARLEHAKALDEERQESQKAKTEQQQHDQAVKNAKTSVEALSKGLKQEIALLKTDADQREAARIVMQAENTLRAVGIELTKKEADELRRLIAERDELIAREEKKQKRKVARDEVNESLAALEAELKLIGMTADERERAIAVEQFSQSVAEAGLATGKEQIKQFEEKFAKLQQLTEIEAIAQGIGDAFASAFEDFLTGAASAGEAAKALLKDLQRLILRSLVLKPLSEAISTGVTGLFASDGAVLNRSEVVPFASGGVVSAPTFFPMSGGRTGLLGESGPEAILPLKRTSSGQLGVEGGGGISIMLGGINIQSEGDFLKLSASEQGRIVAEHVRKAYERDHALRQSSVQAQRNTL